MQCDEMNNRNPTEKGQWLISIQSVSKRTYSTSMSFYLLLALLEDMFAAFAKTAEYVR